MTRRPIVALVTDAIHPYSFGGREIRYHELSRLLALQADVHMYTMRWWDGPRVMRDGPVTLHGITPRLRLYRGRRRSFRQATLFALACLVLLVRPFDVLKVDHIPQFQLFTLRLVAMVRRKPLIATWHEVWGPKYWQDYLGWGGRLAWWVELWSMRMPHQIIAASPQTAERLTRHLGDRTPIMVAPNGIDLQAVRNAVPDPDTTDLVVVTRLMVHKRLDMLLDAVALLHAEGRPVTCRVIGTGPEEEELHAQAGRLGIAHAVDFRHDVREQKDVYSLIKAGRVFAFPSEREGFGIAVLEALACGVPVVTTSAPDNLAQHLVVRSQRGLVSEHTPAALALAIGTALAAQDALDGEDPWLGDPWIGDYSWDAIASRISRRFWA
ncbi:glycosyltransferase family 4 protein [Actinomadura macrotermitis]|uniref:Glycosyltransferase Gtf1 n=1 Tax=Actinomadura macrotermitis TaxID=2585200 RepID=A0A7K0BNW6_9ACTN|nr:glycosyltransferase family 4 protein [Actinomadura macrotermitis]MQY02889.1 Glycosyltransferase Gtf1 [Actinomadura macrotermitis]